MAIFTKRARDVFAPTTVGGAPRGANMGEAQIWGVEVERAIGAGVEAANILDYGEDVGEGDGAADTSALADAFAEDVTRVVFPGGRDYEINALPAGYGTRSAFWDADLTATFSGSTNVAGGFLYARSNELHRAAGLCG